MSKKKEDKKKQYQIWKLSKNGAITISFTEDEKEAEKKNKKYRDRNKKKVKKN